MVLAMIQDLPAHSRLSASSFDPETLRKHSEGKSEAEINWYHERRIWDRPEMQMYGLMVNLLGDLRTFVPSWTKKPPPFSAVGPPEWRDPELLKEKKPATVMDVMRVFGYQGDSNQE